jgi:O-acetylhomoserine/O-acetylserine sulfhydrylase
VAFSFAKNFGIVAFAMALRIEIIMEVGSVLNLFAAQQILLGMETLSLRCDRIAANALSIQIAHFLADQDKIKWIDYPSQ